MTKFTRRLALPIITAGIVGAALGLAGTATAQTQTPTGPGHSYAPQVEAHPAPSATPGWRAHHGAQHIADRNRQMGL
jgi:hypothetical protein